MKNMAYLIANASSSPCEVSFSANDVCSVTNVVFATICIDIIAGEHTRTSGLSSAQLCLALPMASNY